MSKGVQVEVLTRNWWKNEEPATPNTLYSMPKKLPNKLYSLSEMAERLGVSYDTLYRGVRNGELKCMRVRRQYRVSEEAVLEFCDLSYTSRWRG